MVSERCFVYGRRRQGANLSFISVPTDQMFLFFYFTVCTSDAVNFFQIFGIFYPFIHVFVIHCFVVKRLTEAFVCLLVSMIIIKLLI